MDLKDFVSQSLTELHDGVADAIERHTKLGRLGAISVAFKKDGVVNWKECVRDVEFEVAVTTSEKVAGSAKGGLKVASIAELGGDASKSLENSAINKIKFSIPMIFPAQVFDDMPSK